MQWLVREYLSALGAQSSGEPLINAYLGSDA
jgi:hypothetical protein